MVVNNWFETTIGEQATLQRGIDITRAEQRPGRVPVVSSGGISSYHDTVQIKAPGVVLGRKGVVGSVYYIPEDYWPHDTTLWVKDFHGNHPRFIYYFFKSIASLIARMDVGSANPTLNRNHVHPIKVLWPPIAEQKTIAHILGTLDDKIELNQQMNQTLEAIARALFKSWFIDFDPVRAKLDGRQPIGMDAETAALFPAEFEDGGAIGQIPKGWTVKKLKDVLEVSRSGLKPEEFREESFDYFSLPAFDEGKLPKVEEGNQIKSNKYIVHNNAVLLSKLNPHIPRVWLPSTSLTRRAVCSTEFLVILPLQGMTCEYLYSLCNSQGFLETFSAMVTGTSGSHQRVKPEYLLNMDIVVSSPEITSQFTEIVGSFYRKVHENLSESQIFSSIRDALLPKLLSGEIRVQDAETVVEAVT